MDTIFQNIDTEKRNRIINAAIEEFSLYPYEKASTNNIVKNAGISKGLLFHYFGNKNDMYESLISFVLNKLFDDITSQIAWEERDIFERIKALIIVKIKMSKMYPNMFNFILKVLSEKNTNTIEDVTSMYEKYGVNLQNLLSDVYTKNIDFSLFRELQLVDKSINIIRWTMERYAEESILKIDDMGNLYYDKISAELDEYISILKKTFYY